MQHGPRPPRRDDTDTAATAAESSPDRDDTSVATDAGSPPAHDVRTEQGAAEPSGSLIDAVGLSGQNLFPGLLFLCGIILALMILMRGTKRSHSKRAAQTESMENPSDRLAQMHRQASMSMEPASRALVEIEEVGRRFSAMLDNKAVRLEQLLEDADERIARLERATNPPKRGEDDGTDRTPGVDPSVMDRARVEEDRAARADNAHRFTIRDDDAAGMGETRERVWALADDGHDAPAIASRLGVPVGQVELMLNLRRESG